MNLEKILIIAEAGVNHNGNLHTAMDLCDAAKEAGADVVKFQTWITEDIITHTVAQAKYQKKNTGKVESQFDMLKRLELPYDDFRKIKQHCDDIGIIFASSTSSLGALDFLVNIGEPFIKIGSGEIGNVSTLRYMGSKKIPVILSTGMSSIGDIDFSINALREGGAEDITLLHCTTSYPCSYEDVNLNAMHTLREAFHLPVGYSDHTMGIEVSIAAAAMGARVIEKHFTIDRNMFGPDQLASTEPDEFKRMVDSIRHIEVAMGDGIKRPTRTEKEISKVVTKRIVAAKPIRAGEVFSDKNITVKRNDIGILAKYWDFVMGRKASKDYISDEGIII